MGMPPDGAAAWFHSSDNFTLSGEGGQVWAAVSAPVTRKRLTVTFPVTGAAGSFFFALEIAVSPQRVRWTYHHPLLTAPRKVTWTPSTPEDDLVPHHEIRARRSVFEDHVPDAPLLATVRAGGGAASVLDPRGLVRLHLRLGGVPDPAWPEGGERGALLAAGEAVVTFCMPNRPDARVEVIPTSLP
jgi:hypothetical protein